MKPTSDKTLYIHIPFCVRRCIYCAFYLETLGTGPISKRLRDYDQSDNSAFIRALDLELCGLPTDFSPTSIYLGGGTPTELSQVDFEALFENIHARIDTSAVREWTIEANPGTLTPEKIETMLRRGVNRVSLGVQTFDPDTLEFLGRLHDTQEARESYARLRTAGCTNISLDLMIAIPGRSTEVLHRDIDILLALEPEHASAYALELDHGAPLQELADKGLFHEMDDDLAAEQYDTLIQGLQAGGIHQYEISNFSRPGFESIHNQHYWNGGEYHGCGPSASGHIDGVRYKNIPNLQKYCSLLEHGQSPRGEEEHLDPESKARESLMLALRQRAGISDEVFSSRTGFSYYRLAGETIEALIADGLLEMSGDHLRLTDRALFISDGIFADLL